MKVTFTEILKKDKRLELFAKFEGRNKEYVLITIDYDDVDHDKAYVIARAIKNIEIEYFPGIKDYVDLKEK